MKTTFAIEYDHTNEVIHASTGQNYGTQAYGLTFDARENNFGLFLDKWNNIVI